MTPLIQCPFCGSLTAPHVTNNVDVGYSEYIEHWAYTVVCDASPKLGGCGATCGFQDTAEEAIKAWNRRCEE